MIRAMNPMTPIGQLAATGTGEVRDADGNLLSPATPSVRDDGHLLLGAFDSTVVAQEKDA